MAYYLSAIYLFSITNLLDDPECGDSVELFCNSDFSFDDSLRLIGKIAIGPGSGTWLGQRCVENQVSNHR